MPFPNAMVNQPTSQFLIGVIREWKFANQHFSLDLLLASGWVKMPNTIARYLAGHGIFDHHDMTAGIILHVIFERTHEIRDRSQRGSLGKDDRKTMIRGAGCELDADYLLEIGW
ncbi:hypothetical protein FOPE_10039 [Fonsecaea pedrosoi]|nr:hypothetical protein FOPE_10039 [Fonsecaea pedrosoi]